MGFVLSLLGLREGWLVVLRRKSLRNAVGCSGFGLMHLVDILPLLSSACFGNRKDPFTFATRLFPVQVRSENSAKRSSREPRRKGGVRCVREGAESGQSFSKLPLL